MRQALPLSFSADGSALLVASNVPGTQQLYVVPSRGGELRQLTDFPEPVSGQFLPDGRILLEMDERGNERTQLYLLDAEPGAEPEPLVVDPRFMHATAHVGRDGTLLAYTTNRRNGRDFDVVARTLPDGEERTIERGGLCGVESISPDGRWIAFGRVGDRAGDSDLFLWELDTGDVVHVSPHGDEAEYLRPVWLADSSGFLAATNEDRDTFAIRRYDLESRSWETVVESRWDLECAGDDAERSLLVLANEDGYSRLELRDPRTLELREEVPLPGRGVVAQPVFSKDGSLLAFGFARATEPYDVYLYDLDAHALTRLTVSPRDVDPATLVEPELHRFASFDGESIPVFLYEPEGEGPFPVVVSVHGGPESQARPEFAPLTQHLVSRGYAVAVPNVRGSTGYGKRYEHLDDIEKRLDSVRDLAALHEWLEARPEIDGSEAVLYGRSYGGYMVLAGLAFQPDLWAAGIECVGIASLVTFLENTSAYRRAAREREYGSLERDRDFLVEASPLTHVDAIRAPLFVQHGRHDPRVPVGESEQIHRVLTEKG
ncbi:MAG TPA: prolyl oligopeptidase family serine peptidase, partial [Gaiellaceae bacterium]|nr:prolyl oligopeptidase family serine peptidase [Gaiellaceae bacterium]